jgi:hypothetical protein
MIIYFWERNIFRLCQKLLDTLCQMNVETFRGGGIVCNPVQLYVWVNLVTLSSGSLIPKLYCQCFGKPYVLIMMWWSSQLHSFVHCRCQQCSCRRRVSLPATNQQQENAVAVGVHNLCSASLWCAVTLSYSPTIPVPQEPMSLLNIISWLSYEVNVIHTILEEIICTSA